MAKNSFDQQNINSRTKKQNLKLIMSDSWIEGLYDAFGRNKTIKYYILSDEILRATGDQRKFLANASDMKNALKVWTEKSLIPEKWQLDYIKNTFNFLESIIDIDFKKVAKLEEADMPIVITGIPNSSSVSGKNDKIRDHVLFMSHQAGLPSPYHEREAYSYKHDAYSKKLWNKTLMHEVAHFLGLEHPWDKKDGDKDFVKNYTEDTTNENAPFKTLMGYNDGYGKHGAVESIDVFESFQDRDLAALQQIWGIASSPNQNDIDSIVVMKEITGSIKNNNLRGKKTAVHLKGMGGNDKLIGSKKDDILDGGDGNDVLIGKKGADTYVLSSGKDKFKGFKLKEGDTIEIDSDISYKLVQSNKNTIIQHDDGVITVLRVQKDELAGVVEII